MISLPEKSDCCGCSACYNICPVNAIEMQADQEGFAYPAVDGSICVKCGKCVSACPVCIGESQSEDDKTKAYWAINNDEKTRNESSSGGVFSVLAEKTLKNGGVVFGAAMSDNMRSVNHICISCSDDLPVLRGSKYMQSDISDMYRSVREYLDKNVEVLFSGVPCQIEGLLAFLGKDYDNLLCVDFICHGVPSVRVWNKYVDFVERKQGSGIRSVNFRSKAHGWHTISVSFSFEDGSKYESKVSDDLFMKAFLNDVCLRPSCYKCRFKKIHRKSDVTLADFWGVDKLFPEIDDDKGTSLLMIHSEKGNRIFELSSDKIKSGEVDIKTVAIYNSAMIKSSPVNKNRTQFFSGLESEKFDKLVNKYAKPSLYRRIRRKLGKIKNSILKQTTKKAERFK